jgi:hypothetical protein
VVLCAYGMTSKRLRGLPLSEPPPDQMAG